MDSPYIRPFPRAKASQMGGRYPPTATPHEKRRCRRESVTTLPVGPDGAGESTDTLTPAATTLFRAAAKAWIEDLDRPRAVSPMAGGS